MKIIGLMSGTSVDGIDAALVEIEGAPPHLRWKLHAFVCVPHEPLIHRGVLGMTMLNQSFHVQDFTALHFLLGEKFAEAAEAVAKKAGISLREVDAIASHGHTLWHQPTPHEFAGHAVRGTLQIGEPAIIAARTGCKVVADFRTADMALGGQGAPLVPFADHALFASPDETRVMLNLGGIANVTYLLAGGRLDDILAFDTGPANMLIDLVTDMTNMETVFKEQGIKMDERGIWRDGELVTAEWLKFDKGGEMAGRGQVCEPLVTELLEHPYFSTPPPKSTGREEFGQVFLHPFLSGAHRRNLSPEDKVATVTALTAASVEKAFRDWLLPRGAVQTVILGGGGVHNRTLVKMLTERLAPARVTTHAEFGLPDDAKEAVAFAILGYETLHGRPSNVPSATGASGPAILGKIVLPPIT